MFKVSDVYLANYNSTGHVVVNQGGTSSGKTYAIMQLLFVLAASDPKSTVTVVGQDIPNLKVGALKDALSIYESSEEFKTLVKAYNKADRIFWLKNGSKIEFNSYDNAQDAKSGKRTYLFINEANGIPYEFYTELSLRTTKKIFIDYNPNASFWVHDKLLGKPDVQLIISDHRHNPFLDQKTRDKIEALREDDEQLWWVYARGVTGKIEGLILSNWHICESIPDSAKLIAHGLDFGFTNDPTGCLTVYKQDGELWVDELFYQYGLTNNDISKQLLSEGVTKYTDLIADSAEPKSIEELRRMGWRVEPALKGADSINLGLDILKRYRINVTRRSVNLIMELGRYVWKKDRLGKSLNEPIDKYNHLIDPLRYVALNKLKVNQLAAPRISFGKK